MKFKQIIKNIWNTGNRWGITEGQWYQDKNDDTIVYRVVEQVTVFHHDSIFGMTFTRHGELREFHQGEVDDIRLNDNDAKALELCYQIQKSQEKQEELLQRKSNKEKFLKTA